MWQRSLLLHITEIPTKRQSALSHNTQQMKSQRCVCVWGHLSPKLTPLYGCLSHILTNRWFGSVTLTTFQGPVSGEELSHTSLHNYTRTYTHTSNTQSLPGFYVPFLNMVSDLNFYRRVTAVNSLAKWCLYVILVKKSANILRKVLISYRGIWQMKAKILIMQ